MDSLDETYERLRYFHGALLEFNEALRASLAELRDYHATIDALWTDEAARAYHKVYEPLADVIDRYVVHEAPRFEDFIDTKVRQLDDYLHRA